MQDELIQNLREALKLSPQNIPLRLTLAEALLNNKLIQEAEAEYKVVLEAEPQNIQAKAGLAKIYFAQEKYSTAIVILEDVIELKPNDVSLLMLLSKALLRNEESSKAIDYYKQALQLNPSLLDDELDQYFRKPAMPQGEVEELLNSIEQEVRDMERPTINFDDVGGMTKVKEEIRIKIIQPLLHPELYKAYGKKVGGGILLYGPPGCGKTHLARATAGQINASFISVGIHDVLDMWSGQSERKLHELFELARRRTPCVLFFDEIDALGASRSDMRHSSSKTLINQFLTEMDGLDSSNDGVLILGATNAPWHLDAAFRRPGRFDRIVFVQPPDVEGRNSILKILLKEKPVDNIDYNALAKQTSDFSGADLRAVIDVTIEEKLRESFEKGIPQPIRTKDLLASLKQVKPSTKEWFNTARNYALYANDSGLYDEILEYLKIKK
ncbi:ATP-binding protein [Ohtaekwangia koreensis]|uniref:TPR repeat-containing protein n=1 Tax=Ohtaekwangia koreensis TaxID=688867 RepID=A0A1T5IN24_9BACT|nr:ATP-binding protein [Ohtaekwangia koreensis]SKC40408.1 TPR repeat-containing protein [Ohtaekwangia koreensis]